MAKPLATLKKGNVYFRGQYKEGLAVGEWLTYFYDSLQVFTKKTYRDGEENGLTHGYYTGGHLRYTAEVRRGKVNGVFTYYNENGTVFSTTEYKNGVQDGAQTIFDEDGAVTDVYIYKDGKLISDELKK